MFELKSPTKVTLAHINMRTERHGNDDVDAYDLDFVIKGANADVLALLHPSLCTSLYHRSESTEDQAEIPGVPQMLPNLLFPRMGPLVWGDEMHGVDLVIEYGLGDDGSNIRLDDGKASTKRAELEEGGTTSLFWRFQTSSMPDGVLDKLRKKQKQELTITLVQPAQLIKQAVIDGTVGHPGMLTLDEDAADLFAAEHGDGDVSTHETEWTDMGEVVIEQSQPGTRTARGRNRTKAALDAGRE